MSKKIEIPKLHKHERLLLETVYKLNYEGTRFNFKDVFIDLQSYFPVDFRPQKMSRMIISENGEKIRVLGVMAIQKNRTVAKKIDKMVYAIREELFKQKGVAEIDLETISQKINLPFQEVLFLFNLLKDYHHYYSGAKEEIAFEQYKVLLFDDQSASIHFNYKDYPGAENLLYTQSLTTESIPDEFFSDTEIVIMSSKLDLLIELVLKECAENEKFRNEVRSDLAEMKPLLVKLSKKTWTQTLAGKLFVKGLEKVIFEPAFMKLIEIAKPYVKHLLP